MAQVYGMLDINDTDFQYVNTIGQAISYEAASLYLAQVNADMELAQGTFVEMETDIFAERYKLPGGGRLQRRSRGGRPAASKASGKWDVGYPLEDFGTTLAEDDVTMAYMLGAEFERQIQSKVIENTNAVRFEMLKALFNNTARTFIDEVRGTITVQPLAIGATDGVLYPPILGAETEATSDHYIETGYAAASISDTNNPIATIVDLLEGHFGERTGGEDIVVFTASGTQASKIKLLTDFVEVPDQFVRSGTNTDIPTGLPNVPGRILGRCSGAWVVQWRWIPANYLFGVHLEAPAPLKRRVDPASTGLGRGLQLVARDVQFPLEAAFWRHRFGFGVGNRLNGVCVELGTGGTYTIPTIYA